MRIWKLPSTTAPVRLGLGSPDIDIQRVDCLERLAVSGKLKSFIPLSATQA